MDNEEYEKYLASISFGDLIEIKTDMKETSNHSRLGLVYSELYKRFPHLNKKQSEPPAHFNESRLSDINCSVISNSNLLIIKKFLIGIPMLIISGLYFKYFRGEQSIGIVMIIVFALSSFIPLEWYLKFYDFTMFINKSDKFFFLKKNNESEYFTVDDIEYIEKNTYLGSANWRKSYKYLLLYNIHLVNGKSIQIPNTIKNIEEIDGLILHDLALKERVITYKKSIV